MSALLDHALTTADETRAIALGPGAVHRTGSMFADLFPGQPALVVADENTFAVAGAAVLASLEQAGVPLADEPFIFPGSPTLYADYPNVQVVREKLATLPAAVACSIASGTLNDITKLASGELDRPYLNVCTAASVDGYSAFGAAITVDGFKITRTCPAPAGLVADLDHLVAAPARLTATGYGDLLEKIPAGADWLLADALGVEPVHEVAWQLIQPTVRDVLDRPEQIAAAEPEAIEQMAECHFLSGLAMQATKSSRPASGAGHQFSHTWEMEGHGLDWEPPLSHGFKVGIGTVASCALWEEALAMDVAALDAETIVADAPSAEQVEAAVRATLPAAMADECVALTLAKRAEGDALRARVARIQEVWPSLRERCREQLVSARGAATMLQRAGAPHHPEQIGIGMDHFRRTHLAAQRIRSRYTVLDLLADLGMLEAVVDRLFAPSGFWGRRPSPDTGS
ncbi:sn-glycerol-1-phosphate dehydrogenase [Ruania albidiflava]|uniref:sn-glycerol-1-phosphate dehydrogenase n=1 Tax=Ruania albidiflava TaxID=366586 RepID=UPI0023EFBFE3|nr:sn-glycerol-1-phosphate dehydrogenase [Ruania albidiflava]